MSRYDIAIIGTGPAGISAAITATIRNKNIILIGSDPISSKVAKAHTILNYPGLPAISGEDFANAMKNHLHTLGISIRQEQVSMIYNMGDYFTIQTATAFLESSSIILASGVVNGKTLPGEESFLGMGVSYCATCDAALYKGKKVAVIGYSQREEKEAQFLTEYASEVLYFPVYKKTVNTECSFKVINEIPKEIKGSQFAETLVTDKNEYSVDGVFILRESIAPDKLVPGLELLENHVKVDRSLHTNIPGLFACGDITGRPYQYVKAAGEGNVAALSAVEWLSEQK